MIRLTKLRQFTNNTIKVSFLLFLSFKNWILLSEKKSFSFRIKTFLFGATFFFFFKWKLVEFENVFVCLISSITKQKNNFLLQKKFFFFQISQLWKKNWKTAVGIIIIFLKCKHMEVWTVKLFTVVTKVAPM